MRVAHLILLLALCGCDPGNIGPGPTQAIRNGKDQLVMNYVSTPLLPNGHSGYDFEGPAPSLRWV